jgi:hypothetical protein
LEPVIGRVNYPIEGGLGNLRGSTLGYQEYSGEKKQAKETKHHGGLGSCVRKMRKRCLDNPEITAWVYP